MGDPNALIFPQLDDGVTPEIITFQMFFPPDLSRMPSVRPDGIKLSTTIRSREGWRFSFNGNWNDSTYSEFSFRNDRNRYRIDEVDALTLEATGGVGVEMTPSGRRCKTRGKATRAAIMLQPTARVDSKPRLKIPL